jgi:hypothetical protein
VDVPISTAASRSFSSPSLSIRLGGLFQRYHASLDVLDFDSLHRTVEHALGSAESNGVRRTWVRHEL